MPLWSEEQSLRTATVMETGSLHRARLTGSGWTRTPITSRTTTRTFNWSLVLCFSALWSSTCLPSCWMRDVMLRFSTWGIFCFGTRMRLNGIEWVFLWNFSFWKQTVDLSSVWWLFVEMCLFKFVTCFKGFELKLVWLLRGRRIRKGNNFSFSHLIRMLIWRESGEFLALFLCLNL